MTTDGSGTTRSTLLAEWTHLPDCSCSRTSVGCCLRTAGKLWHESFTDWPASGSWDTTGYYGHPTSEPLTDGSGSSLLPTPTASQPGGTVEGYRGRFTDREAIFAPLNMLVEQLLPTPRTSDSTGA